MSYHAEFGRPALKGVGISTGETQNWRTLELRCLRMGGVATGWPQVTRPPHMCYHVKFGIIIRLFDIVQGPAKPREHTRHIRHINDNVTWLHGSNRIIDVAFIQREFLLAYATVWLSCMNRNRAGAWSRACESTFASETESSSSSSLSKSTRKARSPLNWQPIRQNQRKTEKKQKKK